MFARIHVHVGLFQDLFDRIQFHLGVVSMTCQNDPMSSNASNADEKDVVIV